jgi:hypothetical protein
MLVQIHTRNTEAAASHPRRGAACHAVTNVIAVPNATPVSAAARTGREAVFGGRIVPMGVRRRLEDVEPTEQDADDDEHHAGEDATAQQRDDTRDEENDSDHPEERNNDAPVGDCGEKRLHQDCDHETPFDCLSW